MPTLEALIGWLQISASLSVIILVWLVYAGMVMRFKWTPTTADSVWPFFVGLIQFQLIDLMGPDNLGRWLIVLAMLFALMNIVNHLAMRRARQDAENSEFFDHFKPATTKDFVPLIAVVSVLTVAGGLLWNSDNSGWPAIAALIGPVGWVGAGLFAIWKLTGPNYKKLIPAILYVSILRNKYAGI